MQKNTPETQSLNTILANEGFIEETIMRENPGKPVRIISVRYLSDMPVIQVLDSQSMRRNN